MSEPLFTRVFYTRCTEHISEVSPLSVITNAPIPCHATSYLQCDVAGDQDADAVSQLANSASLGAPYDGPNALQNT